MYVIDFRGLYRVRDLKSNTIRTCLMGILQVDEGTGGSDRMANMAQITSGVS